MSKEIKRRFPYHESPEAPSNALSKRSKMQHERSTPELSLETLSLHEQPYSTYSAMNRYLRKVHVERFGDPEQRERWWEQKDNGLHGELTTSTCDKGKQSWKADF
ncbi:hypothetical protein [Absidia glauca]|uniref:Uncharacterized protein n=1 Tax=Absidia glauca TaxID=4829 RepID=A0A168SUW3_ABSGL|nr:hypothetical protein [Absidia glauca]